MEISGSGLTHLKCPSLLDYSLIVILSLERSSHFQVLLKLLGSNP